MYDQEEWREREQLEEHRAYLEANPNGGSAKGVSVGREDGLDEILLRVVRFEDIRNRAGLPDRGREVKAFWRELDIYGWSSVAYLREILHWTVDDYQKNGLHRTVYALRLLRALDGLDPDCVILCNLHPWNGEPRTLRSLDTRLASRNASVAIPPNNVSYAN